MNHQLHREEEAERMEKARRESQSGKGKRRTNRIRTLSYRETEELKTLPGRIAELEKQQSELIEAMSQPDYYKSGQVSPQTDAKRLKTIERDLERDYGRWEELEAIPQKP